MMCYRLLHMLTILLVIQQIASEHDVNIQNNSDQSDSVFENINQIVNLSYRHLYDKLDIIYQGLQNIQRLCEEGEVLKPEIVVECVQEYGNTLKENVEILPEKLIDFIGDLIGNNWNILDLPKELFRN